MTAVAACSPAAPDLRVEISFPGAARAGPITGRAYLVVSRDPTIPEMSQRSLGHQPVVSGRGVPFFAVDVQGLLPDQPAVIDGATPGYPTGSLRRLPPGEYYLQALLNVYTEFRRADGHVIWAHEDRWEGQHFNWAPGNLRSEVQRVRLDPARGFTFRFRTDQVLHPVEVPPDDRWVRRVRIESKKLTTFWGRPVFLGATVLVPRDYDARASERYPTVYLQGHFDLGAPFGFTSTTVPENEDARKRREERGVETGYQLYRSWIEERFPRMFVVTFQHPTPYFDDSYAVNSANNGPYADALLEELIPHLERTFRMIPRSFARVLTGGSTGGYEALSLQVHYPEFFGGAWVFYPDPIDFRRLFLIDIYRDENAFAAPGWSPDGLAPERYAFRTSDGQPLQSVRDLSRLASVLGSRGRSSEYLEAWDAAFGPVGRDGYPRPLFDKTTGVIDRAVADYWRDQGYDLSHYLRQNWSRIGRHLAGKLHFISGEMDNYYFEQPLYLLQEFLEGTRDPPYGGSFRFGRPNKGHGWTPVTNAQLLQEIAAHVKRNAPAEARDRAGRP